MSPTKITCKPGWVGWSGSSLLRGVGELGCAGTTRYGDVGMFCPFLHYVHTAAQPVMTSFTSSNTLDKIRETYREG